MEKRQIDGIVMVNQMDLQLSANEWNDRFEASLATN